MRFMLFIQGVCAVVLGVTGVLLDLFAHADKRPPFGQATLLLTVGTIALYLMSDRKSAR